MSSKTSVEIDRQWLDLSLAQGAIWLDAKLSESSAYQLGGWARTNAPLDEAALRQAISLVMARHDGLRLRVDDELPRQWVDDSVEPPLTISDLPAGTTDPDAAFQELIRERFAVPMPLGDHPLFAVELVRAGGTTTYLLWRFHHLVADSASVTIAIYHCLNAYEALTSATPKELTPPSSYLKTLSSDAAYLSSAAYQKDLAYWTKRFDPLPPQLISDLRAHPNEDGNVPTAEWKLVGDAFNAFQDAAKAAEVTLQRALFALFAMALGRRYGQTDLALGVALHRRDLANRGTVGMMAGVIAARCQFDSFWTLPECVQACGEQLDKDFRHQRLPVDLLSRTLGLAGTGRAGLFEAVMSYIPAERSSNDAPTNESSITTGIVVSKEASPLSLHIQELPDNRGLAITIAVNTDYLASEEGQAVLTLLKAAVAKFVDQPETRFEELATLTPSEFELVVKQWNDTRTPFESGTLDGLFAAQARRTPDAIAVIDKDGHSLTYAELDEKSTQLARTLAAHGVKAERVVGVRMERSAATIVAALGILKAGGVYLPLDPAYPEERLEYIKYDASAMLVLESLDGLTGEAELLSSTDPRRLAYIIYTSGTTGLPKGVEVPHSAPVNLAFARCACHDPLGLGDRVLAGISVGFDVSIGQLLLPLLSGATVVIAPDLKSLDAGEFWNLLTERRVTHINSVPSFFDSILDGAPPVETLALKRLMLGGEGFRGDFLRRLRQTLPGVEIVNMYGPTEACIDATYHVSSAADLATPVLPIGKPLSNYRAYVLNNMLEPVGIGVAGELYLGGEGLARGYVNAADLTSERFVADPFSAAGRLYRTGDRARWRKDGCIEFLGRVDQQVKIRGFRVEPAEIAAALLEHPAVGQSVVIARAQQSELSVRLIAYFVPTQAEQIPELSDLRSYLAERLPDYMVPSAFVSIGAIPLNRNGKVDEKALPLPDLREGDYVAPRTQNEQLVAQLFAEVLNLDRCGATDHFFELGGHSLLATTLVSKFRVAGITLPIRAIFEAPTVESLARRIETSVTPTHGKGDFAALSRPADIPLSYPQERVWFVDRLQQDSSYNIPIAFELRGKLDITAAEKAIARVVERHEALRTQIVLRNERPAQQILEPSILTLERSDLTKLSGWECDSALRRSLDEMASQRFDLSSDLPVRLRLFVLDANRHVLAAVIHHAAFDGWSAGIFLTEFAALYSAFVENQADPLPALTIQYTDFALWQRQQNWEADLAYWREELQGAPSYLELPARGEAPAESARLASSVPLKLEAPLHAALLQLARDNGASLFMVLHAAFAVLLSRWSGQNDVVIGTVTANRHHSEFESLIGCFINTLALRTTFEQPETFAQLLARVKDRDLAAYAHQGLPFEKLVEALHPERSLQHTPIFQVMLALQNAPLPAVQLPELTLDPIVIDAEMAKFDISLNLAEQDGALAGTFEYSRNRFEPQTVVRLARQFQRLLETVAADASQDPFQISLLDPEECSLVLGAWSGAEVPFPQGTLDEFFRAQVERTPDAIAVIGEDGGKLTYAQLDAESTRVARYLIDQGVRHETVVGVRMPRSTDTIIAFLAVLKAGGVYLPLDPAYPADRLSYMAENAQALLVIDSIAGKDGSSTLPQLSDPNRLAYIIFTSGTTGRPKGVAIPHSAAANLAFARVTGHDPLGPGDRVMAVTSVSFDVSIGQLLFPLFHGATIVIAGDIKTMGGSEFWALVVRQQVTHVNFVPSFVDSILDSVRDAGPLPLKMLMLGGEGLSGALLKRIHNLLPGLKVVNIYGPTETCIDATYYVATPADTSASILPIGRPLANYRAYILSGNMDPVEVGVAGELFIGGAGLARGYVGAAELTAERFIADPFSSRPGARMYRTGDRARWSAGGTIEFLGRVDQQVKIRGFRVEPGEIESQLRKLPGIRDAAVIARQIAGDMRLIAYYSCDSATSQETLRESLSAILPPYMVPSAFIELDQLPVSTNGKLDRKALPEPTLEAFSSRAFEPPIGPVEEKMAGLWAEFLKLERVGRHDNFFELGGHSLLAVSLIERMKKEGMPADVRSLFLTPTVAGMAATLDSPSSHAVAPPNRIMADCEAITPDLLPLVPLTQSQIDCIVSSVPGGVANIQDIYPLAPLQEGILFQHRMTTEGDPYLTPFLLSFDTRERIDSFIRALNQVVARHDVLRTAIVWKELNEPVQVVLCHVTVPVEEIEFDASGSVAAKLRDKFDPRHYRLDLTKAPLVRAAVAFDHSSQRWLVLLLTHHLILDHTSMEIVVHELRTLMADTEAALPPGLPYRNFIAATRAGANQSDQQAFFTRMLGDVDEPTAPFGLLDVQSNGGQTLEARLALDPALARRIRQQARTLGVTPASIFHSAWAAVLNQISPRSNPDKSNVVFGTVLFGRMRSGAGADRVVGMFINTLPIRLDVDSTAAADHVVRTHRLLAELMVHEHAPLTLAQRCSSLPPPAPLFSSLFNYRYSAGDQANTQWPGVEMLEASERTSYPLAMAVDDLGTNFLLTALAHPSAAPERLCNYLHQTLTNLVDLLEREPRAPFDTIDVLPRTERHLITEEWNRTDAKFEQGTLDGLFTAQARRTPNALAVIDRTGSELTYAELDARSTVLARQLVTQGIRPEQVVGVRMERSADTIIALLAILKAGGVYLPLDPAYPADRLSYIASDAGAKLILDSIEGLQGTAELPQLTDPNRLAYIIYTSGTTGRPKGVAVSHVAPVNLAFARRACHDPIGPGDRVLAAISVGFDVSIGQLLLPLLSGATVVVAGDLKTMAAAEFWSLLAKRQVTHINSVPSFFDSVLDAVPSPGTLALKRLMLGGEALNGSLVARIQKAISGVTVVNMYGPTEACIDATYHVATDADFSAAVLPIGRPLSNYNAYVLDRQRQPVGIGVMGELYLGGLGLARGYVNAPELTSERFVPNPFSASSSDKLYRTGDLARWRADGEIEFLGRVDQQVKIRGFRVEPGEIEAQMLRLAGIREAAVVPHVSAGNTRLIGYFSGDDTLTAETLREAMARELPDYMVPTAFLRLDRLPLTPNGKLDRKALPNPEKIDFVSKPFEEPAGDAEKKMAALWADILKVERVGRHDNFFELGGHSLLAMTLAERMQQQGIAVDVRTLFSSPTIAELAAASSAVAPQTSTPDARIAPGALRITPEMLPLVQLTQAQIDKIVQSIPGGATNVQDIYPLSPLQEGILFQHLMSTEGDPYLAPFLLAFDNRDRLNNFVGALHKIAERHDVLRTAIVTNDLPVSLQVVLRQVLLPLEEVSIEIGKDVATQLLERFSPATYRLDLSQAPLLRAAFAHDAAKDRWLLLMLTHHLILDHTSMAIMVGDLRALMSDAHANLPAPVPYRNFIAQTLQDVRTEHEHFFKKLLGDVDEPTTPFSLVESQGENAAVTEQDLRIDASLSQRIRDLARTLGVSPASLFHLAWASVLGFASGKSDVVFGTVLLGRMRSGEGADRAVGMFINTLPVRIALDETGARAALLKTQALLADLMVHEHAPLALAQRASSVPPPGTLFSSIFNYRYSPEDEGIAWPGVEMLHSSERTNYPVSMAVDDSGRIFTLRAIAHPKAGAARICQYLLTAINGLAEMLERKPEAPIHSLGILPAAERALVTKEWNQTAAVFERGTLDNLFASQAQRTPAAVAIISQDGSAITYGDLHSQSNRLASQLAAHGIRPGDVVGVRMQRSAETIIALLAILKAGGVYLPLDPAYPSERLDYMVQDAKAKLVLESIHSLSGEASVPQLTDPERLAYIIYTSGTTGRPKGVAVSHVPPVNLAFARRACHDPIGPGDRVLAAISVGFDVSIGQLLLPLLSGATVVIAADLKTLGPAEFWAFLGERRVTHINSVPSFFDSILDAVPAAGSLALKRLMLGGEPLSGSLVSRIQRAIPGIEVVNMYGPTEACIDATYHVATPADSAAPVLPIGRPLTNYRAYILNSRFELAGVGIPGDLYLGGLGIAQGYVNAPELTNERFIPDPFSGNPSERLYRTGDRAQWRDDGVIEFLGRADKQVKIRGHRIELGEIEAALLSHPNIGKAAVIAEHHASGNARLICYFVIQPEASAPPLADLRAHLSKQLPEYMIPAAFAELDALPLTANGKLDLAALPKVSSERTTEEPYQAPRTETEAALEQICRQILNLERISIHDNFFALGGHSLAAMRLINLCNSQFHVNLPLRVLFDCPTIAELAAAIDNNAPTPDLHPCLVRLQSNGTNPPLFCVHPAGGHVLGYTSLATAISKDQPLYGLQARGLFPGQPQASSMEEMATEYLEAIKTVQPNGPYQLLGRSSGGLLAYEMAQQLKKAGEAVSFLCLLDTSLPSVRNETYTEDEMMRLFARNIGLMDLVSEADTPKTAAELLARGQAANHLQNVETGQFERFYAVFRNSVNIYPKYRVQPWSGPFVLFRAMKRLGGPEDQPPDWSSFVGPEAITINMPCTHDDFAREQIAPTLALEIERLLADVAKASQPVKANYLLPLEPTHIRRPLFCVHPAGGSPFCYLPLSQKLGKDQPLAGLRASGLEVDEPLASSIEEMASEYISAILKLQPEGPYQLLGMSSGGIIALEMARQLSERSQEVSLVALLDTSVPGSHNGAELPDDVLLRAMSVELACRDLLEQSPQVKSLPQLVELGIHAGRLPQNAAAYAERVAAVFKNMVRLQFAYTAKPWAGATLLVRALRRERAGDSVPDWSQYLSNVQVIDIDCTHEDLVSQRMAPAMAALLAQRLN